MTAKKQRSKIGRRLTRRLNRTLSRHASDDDKSISSLAQLLFLNSEALDKGKKTSEKDSSDLSDDISKYDREFDPFAPSSDLKVPTSKNKSKKLIESSSFLISDQKILHDTDFELSSNTVSGLALKKYTSV